MTIGGSLIVLQATSCANVYTNGWPSGFYTFNGTQVWCYAGKPAYNPPFASIGNPLAYYPFDSFVLVLWLRVTVLMMSLMVAAI